MISLARLRQTANLLLRCLRVLEGQRLAVVAFVVLSFLAAVTEGIGVSLLLPFLEVGKETSALQGRPFFGPFLDVVNSIPQDNRLTIVAVALMAVFFLRGLLLFFVQVMSNWLPLNLQLKLMDSAYGSLLNVEVGYLSRSKVGTVNDAIAQLPLRISSVVMHVASAQFNLVLAAAYVVLMLAVSPWLTLATLTFFGVITLLLRKVFSRPLSVAGQNVTERNSNVSSMIHETINGLRLVRLSSAEQAMHGSFSNQAEKLNAAKKHIHFIKSIPSPVLSTTAGIFICVLLVGGGAFFPGEQAVWITSVLMFNIMVLRLLSPVSALNEAWHYIQSDIHAFDQYDLFMETMDESRQLSGDQKILDVKEGLRFEDVTFCYPESEESAVKNLTLDIPVGTMLALVGPSGSGKSTVAALIGRLFDPQSGRLFVDGGDLRDLEIKSWHKLLGYVSQDAFMFNDTLANNMRIAKPGASDDEIHEAIRRAAAEDVVAALQDGLDTHLGHRGTRLSGGQLQRIALARVILADPRVVVLDEATSALDSISEATIQSTIEELREDRIIIAIAHRLSTIAKADKIVVLQDGGVQQQGTHQALQRESGLYKELLSHQAEGMIV